MLPPGRIFHDTDLFILVERRSQVDATQWFIDLIICSTCFGHYYAHHQGLETIQKVVAHDTWHCKD